MKKLIIVKLGGSLITDKTKINKARFDVIENLAKQIKDTIRYNRIQSDEISKKKPIKSNSIQLDPILSISIIIATGAGGFGHPVAKKYEHNLKEGLPFIKKAVKNINNIVVSSLNKVGIKALPVEPSKISKYCNGKMILLLHGSIVSLLKNNIIPVFHADLVDDMTKGVLILSMDRFLVDVAIFLKDKGYDVIKVIFCGTTDGVIDAKGKTINKINKGSIKSFSNLFYDNKTIDTSGGMNGKVSECLRLIDKKIPCILINGQKENNLFKAILGQEVLGTEF